MWAKMKHSVPMALVVPVLRSILISLFTNDLDEEMENTHGKLAGDTRFVSDLLECREVLQRCLDRLVQWY